MKTLSHAISHIENTIMPDHPGKKLSSGSWLLNLACSNNPDYSMTTGRYYWMAGASSSGKTFWTLQHLAEAAINPEFDEYDLIFDDVEGGAMMDIAKFFGPKLAKRIQSPHTIDGIPSASDLITDFYGGLYKRFEMIEKKKAKKFIYLCDSMDALRSGTSEEKFRESIDNDDVAGDYNLEKAKTNSMRLPEVVAKCEEHDCIVIILSQLRDNIGAKMFQKKHITSGGNALKYYATWQLWSTLGKEFKKTVHGNDRQIGITSRISVEKNRLSGKEWVIELPIYWTYGIDDIGGCVDFLIDEKSIKNTKAGLIAPDFNFEGSRNELILKIHQDKMQRILKAAVVETWRDIEQKCAEGIPMVNKYQED